MAADTSEPSLVDVVIGAARSETDAIRVAMTARIDQWNRAAGTVDVTPCTQVQVRTSAGVEWRSLGQLRDVRVAWPSGGGAVLTMPLQVGDLVTLLVRDTSHGEVDAGTDVYPARPTALTRWSAADAVAIPGYTTDAAPHPATASSTDDVVIYMPGGRELRIGSSAANEALALARRVKEELDAISAAFSAHTHSLGNLTSPAGPVASIQGPSIGSTGPSATYTASAVASARAFVDS